MIATRPLAITFLTLSLALLSTPAIADEAARVVQLSGTVEILPHGAAPAHAAKADEPLEVGDVIRTGPQSTALVLRADGSQLELQAVTEITLENEHGILVTMGRLWSHFVKAVGTPHQVRTPGAAALIRGTTLTISYEQRESEVAVYEGLVEVHGAAEQSRMVEGGFRVHVDPMGRMNAMERVPHELMEQGRGFRTRAGLEGGPGGMRGPRGPMGPGGPGGPGDRSPGDRGPGMRERGGQRLMDRGPMGPGGPVGTFEQRMDRIERQSGDRLDRQEQRERRDSGRQPGNIPHGPAPGPGVLP